MLITPLLFLATMLLAQITCQLSGLSTCLCLKTKDIVLRKKKIRSYMIQKADVCHIDAIIFKTVRGFTYCLDPQKPWVRRFLESKATTARPINSASRLNTSSHWNGQDKLGTSSPELFEFINEGSGFSYCPCLKMSETVLRMENIKSYKIYEAGVCHIDAIEFKTISGLNFCANPKNLWVKRAMQFVDEKKASETTARPINSTLSFKTESKPKTSHWNGQDEQTSSPELAEFANLCL